jgi:hypothetical protein
MEEDGDFVVVWDSNSADGGHFGVFGKRYDSSGAVQSGDFQIDTTTSDDQSHPSVTRSAGGVFVVVWRSDGQDDPPRCPGDVSRLALYTMLSAATGSAAVGVTTRTRSIGMPMRSSVPRAASSAITISRAGA